MISEGQIRALLRQCEARLGRPLAQLRTRLRSDRGTLRHIWELVVLSAACRISKDVEHEPTEQSPDVAISCPSGKRLFIEATHIDWKDREFANKVGEFLDWARDEVCRIHSVEPTTFRVRIEPVSQEEDLRLPDPHQFAQVRKNTEWRQAVGQIGQGSVGRAEVEIDEVCSLRVELFPLPRPSQFVNSSYADPRPTKWVRDHPLFGVLRRKARQARKFKLNEPIVLCVGSSLSTSLFERNGYGVPGPEPVVLAALTRAAGHSMNFRYNWLRDSSAKEYRVPGAGAISGVLLVSLESSPLLQGAAATGMRSRFARVRLVLNPEAERPLSDECIATLRKLDFNAVPFGPQWETWSDLSRAEKQDKSRVLKRHQNPGLTTFSYMGDGRVRCELPAETVVRVLAGLEPADESVRDALTRFALERGLCLPDLVSAEVVPGDPAQRQGPTIILEFGRPKRPVVQE